MKEGTPTGTEVCTTVRAKALNDVLAELQARVRYLERQLIAHQTGMTVEGCDCPVCKERREIARLRAARIGHAGVPKWRCAPGTHVRVREEDGCLYCGLVGADPTKRRSRPKKVGGTGEP